MEAASGWAWASCLHGCPPRPTPQGVRVSEVTMGVEEEEAAVALVNEVVDVEEEEEQGGTEGLSDRPSRSHRDHTKVRHVFILSVSHASSFYLFHMRICCSLKLVRLK